MKNHNNTQVFAKASAIAQSHSPFLSRLLLLHPQILQHLQEHGADIVYADFCAELKELAKQDFEQKTLMKELRLAKGRLALLTALCDIAEIWQVEQVTNALSDFAESCLKIAIDFILSSAQKRGEIALYSPSPLVGAGRGGGYKFNSKTPPPSPLPQEEGGYYGGNGLIVLGMGKLGGRELNYSSDIDLILFYEANKIGYIGRHNEQHFMNKLAHELVLIMQERTADGYVFRTDLRLRPDPASTPPAVSVDAAYAYYESVGQNWERAAMIKARPVAGDIEAGERFLKSLTPFMWRRNLDFAAINDIHSIKRQMDSRQNPHIQAKGHNVKLGLGGIREIEFFVQINQLIWGGREAKLRIRATCFALDALTDFGLVDELKKNTLYNSYRYLRKLEHRIQMVADEQTHSLPNTDLELQNISRFMGYKQLNDFEEELLRTLHIVHDIYVNSFRSGDELSDNGNLVFTGVSHDEATLATIRDMGYKNAEIVSEIIMGWHHGSRRSTRTKRARELLTEMTPTLLKRLAETANPDTAFLKFNEFLYNLPASVQLFSLFQINPQLLTLIADIMGNAPSLAESLSKNPELLDAVLYADFYNILPTTANLQQQLQEKMNDANDAQGWDFEEKMDKLREFRNEKQFQAGVQLLKQMIDARQASEFLSNLAELMVKQALALVMAEFEKTYGKIAGSRFAIITLGKLGSREMTFSSDIDLVFVYDTPDFEAFSDGEKQFTASVYYNRFAQRLLNALSAMGRYSRLYEVDTRLRPSGKQGLMAVSVQALHHYFEELAWTFEYMAFTKARVFAGDETLNKELEEFICKQISKKRDAVKLLHDVTDMRNRMEKEQSSTNIWDIKLVRGGLTDIDFIAQYLLLLHACDIKSVHSGSAADIFIMLKNENLLNAKIADDLLEANQFLGQIFNMLRLCCDKVFDEQTAPDGLKKLLVKSVNAESFEQLKSKLIEIEQNVINIGGMMAN